MMLTQRHIWTIISSYYPHIGGSEQQAQRLSEKLISRGYQVSVLTRRHNPHFGKTPASRTEINGVPVHRLFSRGWSKLGALTFVLSALWHLRNSRGDIYHAHSTGAPAIVSALARRLYGGQSLVKLRGGADAYIARRRSLLGRLLAVIIDGSVDRYVVVSEEQCGVMRQEAESGRLVQVPNGIDVEYFHPAEIGQRAQARVQLGLPANALIVLYVGRLEPVKGADILLKAWARLSPALASRHLLLLVGDGSQRTDLERHVRVHRLQDEVCFAGRQENILPYLHASDLFVLPSRSEGFSNALMEAMACGLPVIASRVGGTPDVITDGKNGLLYEAEDHEQLCERLLSMLTLREQWQDMGRQGRRTIIEHANFGRVVDEFIGIYGPPKHSKKPSNL